MVSPDLLPPPLRRIIRSYLPAEHSAPLLARPYGKWDVVLVSRGFDTPGHGRQAVCDCCYRLLCYAGISSGKGVSRN
jgi:hypothetical protein